MAQNPVVFTNGHLRGSSHVVTAFHRALPELRAEGASSEAAIDQLVDKLELNLDYASDEFHREPIRRALAEVREVQAIIAAGFVPHAPRPTEPSNRRARGRERHPWTWIYCTS